MSKTTTHGRGGSQDSAIHLNEVFFRNTKVCTQPQTWKSSKMKEKEQFGRIKELVRYFAPEQFKNPSRPTYGPCAIVPRDYEEWVQYQSGIKMVQIEQMKMQIKIKEDLRNAGPDARLPVNSVFCTPDKFNDNRTAVLGQVSIWTKDLGSPGKSSAPWPEKDELRLYGDNRENGKTRCGRFLPPPRHPDQDHIPTEERKLKGAHPLDRIGALHEQGPPPVQLRLANSNMDKDGAFMAEGEMLIGRSLLREELGEQRTPLRLKPTHDEDRMIATPSYTDASYEATDESIASWTWAA